ncbi:type II toxin-antitoxin system mRNA interferase toxin, RelE/StbE family [Candidatus Pacearchaeota archaeon]|nr:type II toxin-antitoxin system mRNA interferase toxin, RelE/StbE family [Candidatus Pacearchaeota archaeon]
MYKIFTANSKTEKRLMEYICSRDDIREKLEKLKVEPRRVNGAHPLHGRLEGKWSCWLGYNIRMIYSIDDKKEMIIIEAVGSHKIY